MAKYNAKPISEIQPTQTLEGGAGFNQTAEAELVGILSVGLENTFYEKESEREQRFVNVLTKVANKNKLFAAKALIYARTVFGQRSVTHRGAVELAKYFAGDEMGKRFYSKRSRKENKGGIVYRLDDMLEILACYLEKNGENAPIPNAIKKGFAFAIEEADTYELAKYQAKNRSVSLVDIVNLVHPIESKKNGFIEIKETDYLKATNGTKYVGKTYEKITKDNESYVRISALRALVLGLLKQFNTVEDKNTEAGKVVSEALKSEKLTVEEAEEKLNELKIENYSELIATKKIGYLALLRNLRNIMKTDDIDLLNGACELLIEEKFIKKSLVWPHMIDLALEIMLLEFNGNRNLSKIAQALNTAYERSIPNLAELFPKGKTAIVFDTSGSMTSSWNGGVKINNNGKSCGINSVPAEKAALIAATFVKALGSPVYHFASGCERILGYNPIDSINTLKKHFTSYNGRVGHGTDVSKIFDRFVADNTGYDRILIITDEQDGGNLENSFKKYSIKFGTPYIYYINVNGYGPVVMKPGQRVFRIYGYSAEIYTTACKVEIDPAVLMKEINAIEI
jgi:hypothetical protein